MIKFSKCLSVLLFSGLIIFGCKSGSDQTPTASIKADSASYSSLIVNCKSSDTTATGIAVINIQQFYLSGTIVSSTIKGKMYSVKTVNLSNFKASVDQVGNDFKVPQPYFNNYDSFISLFDDQFKTKTGFQKSYDMNQSQIEQIFNKQDLSLAYQSKKLRNVFFANVFLLSSGLGSYKLAGSGETFKLNYFWESLNVGSHISGLSTPYTNLGAYFGGITTRVAATTQNDVVAVASYYNKAIIGTGNYTYYYPLPPAPPIVFDAPVWYWHQYTTITTGANFGIVPSNTSPATWSTAQDRYQVLRVKAQQVTGGTVTAAPPIFGTIDPSALVTDAETAYILYSANFIQNYKDAGVIVWSALDTNKQEYYQIGLHSNGEIRIDKFIKASVKGGIVYSTPTWALTWKK